MPKFSLRRAVRGHRVRTRRGRVLLAAIIGTLAVAAVAATALARVRAASPASRATVHEQSFDSPAVHGTLGFRVYLPPGYASGSRRYPVVYLLGGLPDNGTNFRDDRAQQVGAIASSAGRPAIVIAPQASRPGDTDPEYHDWGPGRDWETAISRDLVHTVDARFRTIANRRARAIIGVSAGGYGAAIIAVHHPDTFSLAESWSGYFAPTNPAGTASLSVGDAAADRQASVHSYVGWLARTRAVSLDFYVGASDPNFVADNLRLHRELVDRGVVHQFAIYPGGHTGALWGAHEQSWVTAAARQLLPAR